MKEIGGYIELDTYHLPMLHEGALALNCGRNALAYLLRARKIKHLWIPKLICDSVTGVCEREHVPYSFYNIGLNFLPANEIKLDEGDWFYFVNYYSQFDNDFITKLFNKYKNIIVDNAQSYFQLPVNGVDTLYTCRKYFGVADGAFLYTDVPLSEDLLTDESFERMHFLLGRYERSASEFYSEYVANNDLFDNEPLRKMSKLTWNLLHGIDYEKVKVTRIRNYFYLHKQLRNRNQLKISDKPGTFMYPILLDNGFKIRKRLQAERIYIPMLWPNVFDICSINELECDMAKNILPLPIDQRYSFEDMEYICNLIDYLL